ncbi:MAG: sodium/hydrogen exchanger [Candidatus Paceibacter sp.]|jgi:Kef-type K+ transport system membrane component KefB|nr:sodium/hydrogen exchanger [Candidatus Paceibacter sp.]
MNVFIEVSLIVFIATLVSFIMRFMRQPLVVGYIFSGILVGPYALNILHSTEDIEFFSKIGIAILLFIVGLSLNPEVIKDIGKNSLIIGLGQVILTAVVGLYLVFGIGYDMLSSVYIALALTFSSTIIILKLLSDKGELNKLYGRISIGVLLVQDIVATFTLIVISTIGVPQQGDLTNVIIMLVLKGIVVATFLFVVSKKILPKLSSYFATSQELLFLFSIAWGLGLAALFYGLGFSIEIGALIAGVTLSVSPFAYEIGSRMKPLRDFFIILFFILLGSQMALSHLSDLIILAVILSVFVLVAKPLIVFFVMNFLGYRRRTAFMTGLTVAQISEFSLILASLGLTVKHISIDVASLITLVGIITIAGSTYLILYADKLYTRLEHLLKTLEVKRNTKRERTHFSENYEIIVFGYDRVGNDFVQSAEKLERKYVVVDFNPVSIQIMQSKGIPFKYGDADDVEFLHELEFHQVKLVVSTIPDFKTSMLLIQTYRQVNPSGIILVISDNIDHAEKLYLAGASYVVMPHYLGAHYASQLIAKHGFDVAEFERERNLHLQRLSRREGR